MAAAGAALPLAQMAQQQATDVTREIFAWMAKPLYQRTTVRTRTWTEVDSNGKLHNLSETKTHGWAISNGFAFGTILLVALWEAALAFAQAINPVVKTAEQLAMAPMVLAEDYVGAIVAVGTTLTNDAGTVWNWLTGETNQSKPPASAVKTYTVPPTGMAAMSETLRNIISPVNAFSSVIGGKLVDALQNSTGVSASAPAPPTYPTTTSTGAPASTNAPNGAQTTCPSGYTLMKSPSGVYECVLNSNVFMSKAAGYVQV